MIRRLLQARGKCDWFDLAEKVEKALLSEFSRGGLVCYDLHRLILQYCPPIEEQLALRVGSWKSASYGGEPRYIVTLGQNGTSSGPMVKFPYEPLQACPAREKAVSSKAPFAVRHHADEGMTVRDDRKTGRLQIGFSTGLIFFEHHGYHVAPFETIGIRYQATRHCGVSHYSCPHTGWILLCQVHADEAGSISHTHIANDIDVSVQRRRSMLQILFPEYSHVIYEILLIPKKDTQPVLD